MAKYIHSTGERAPIALAPAPGVPSVYDVPGIAAAFRELHSGKSDITRERLRADTSTALVGAGMGDDGWLVDAVVGV